MRVALFSGLRQAEILQLTVKDVYEKNGIWLFDINRNNGKRVRSDSSVGLVPVAGQLIELRFLDWVGTKENRLFDK